MAAKIEPITMEQGATFFMEFVWREDSDTAPGTPGDPVDLTGYIARMQVRAKQQGSIMLEASSEGATPDIALGGATGKFIIIIADEKTDLLSVKKAFYDLEAEDAAGRVYRVLEGPVTVRPNITQTPGQPVVR